MAWRFTASKFKNTTPKLPKKEETIFDLPVGSLSCTNNGITSSNLYIAFHIEGEGGKLGVVPSDARGRRLRTEIDVVCAHAELVDDFAFLPYEEDVLVTCSRDEKVKVWRMSPSGSELAGEVEVSGWSLLSSLRPHSTASSIVALGSTSSVYVVDLHKKDLVVECAGVVDKALSIDWSEDGRTLAAIVDKGRQTLVWDPRSGSSPVRELQGHSGMGREARCLFAGDKFVSTGFTNKRVQEARVWDARSWEKPLWSGEYTATTGVLIPQYDPDTRLLFLAGKGTNKIHLAEIQDRTPTLGEVYTLNVPDQLLGFSLAPKTTVTPMDGEVARFYQLTKNSVLPIPCIVPRRSYRELHTDLFPDTRGPVAGTTAEKWRNGSNSMPEKVSLVGATSRGREDSPPPEPIPPAPTKAQAPAPLAAPPPQLLVDHRPQQPPVPAAVEVAEPAAIAPRPRLSKQNSDDKNEHKENAVIRPTAAPEVKLRVLERNENDAPRLTQRVRPKSCVVGQVQSKYRHVETVAGVKAGAIFTNLRNINTRLPAECNGAVVSSRYAAIPLAGPAGIIAILDVDAPVKMADGVVDGIYNKAGVTDLQFSPFHPDILAVGTDQGLLNIWKIPELKKEEKRSDLAPDHVVSMGGEKVVCLRWHPVAEGLLAVALGDNTIQLWDMSGSSPTRRLVLHSHSAPALSIAWSSDGQRLASIGRDLELHVWRPQRSTEELEGRVAGVIESTRAARVLFACDDSVIIVLGITKSSGREISLLDGRKSSLPLLHKQHIDNAVQPLVPHYDFDTSVLFLTGKGDRIVNMLEVCPEPPFLLQLTNFVAPSGHQALAFHNKNACNVMEVEFQRAWRLTDKTLECLKFRVPRVKKDIFQSDLFPDALLTWEAGTTAEKWLGGESSPPLFRSVRPDGVAALSLPSAPAPRLAKRSEVADNGAVAPEKKEVMASWSSQIGVDGTLEQDRMEGVAEEEWKE